MKLTTATKLFTRKVTKYLSRVEPGKLDTEDFIDFMSDAFSSLNPLVLPHSDGGASVTIEVGESNRTSDFYMQRYYRFDPEYHDQPDFKKELEVWETMYTNALSANRFLRMDNDNDLTESINSDQAELWREHDKQTIIGTVRDIHGPSLGISAPRRTITI